MGGRSERSEPLSRCQVHRSTFDLRVMPTHSLALASSSSTIMLLRKTRTIAPTFSRDSAVAALRIFNRPRGACLTFAKYRGTLPRMHTGRYRFPPLLYALRKYRISAPRIMFPREFRRQLLRIMNHSFKLMNIVINISYVN